MATVPLCFMDTETTSLDTRTREAWEVGIIRREPDGTEERWSAFVDLAHPELADRTSLKIGRFYDRYPGYTTDPEKRKIQTQTGVIHRPKLPLSRREAAKEIEWRTRDAHIIGAVPSFDCSTLERLLWEEGVVPAGWHYHLIDVESYAAGLLGLEPPYKHDDILAAFGITYDESLRHTALGDAEMDMRLYDAVREARADVTLPHVPAGFVVGQSPSSRRFFTA